MAASPIYLDNNATTPLDPRVLEEMIPVLNNHFGNPSSATHAYGWHAAELVKIARERVAALIGCTPEELVFTSGATEAINLALFGVVRSSLRRGSQGAVRVLSAATEHRATLDPLDQLRREGAEVDLLPVDHEGHIDADEYEAQLLKRPALVSLMLANNEIGTVNPIAQYSKSAVAQGALFHCDAAQAAGKLPVDVQRLGADLVSLSAHKMYGPKGVGALYVRRSCRHLLEPLLLGGGQEGGFRAGTLNVAGIVGMGKAAELAKAELVRDSERMVELGRCFLATLQNECGEVALNGPVQERLPGNLNIRFENLDSALLLSAVQKSLAISVGSACQSASKMTSHVLQSIGLSASQQRSSIRIGIGRMTTMEEIDRAAKILGAAVKSLASLKRG